MIFVGLYFGYCKGTFLKAKSRLNVSLWRKRGEKEFQFISSNYFVISSATPTTAGILTWLDLCTL